MFNFPRTPFTVTVADNTGGLIRINSGDTSYRFAGWNTDEDESGTDYEPGSEFNMPASNVALYPKWVPYDLRDIGPAGGLIFYDEGSYIDGDPGWRYLEAAPIDQSAGAEWGCKGISIDTWNTIGDGKWSTWEIEQACTTPGTAADICWNLTLSGYDDWFLPSIGELHTMHENLDQEDVGDFADEYYWSSSEEDSSEAWRCNVHSGIGDTTDKDLASRVRAARAF